jgi:hypothetical protein
MNLSVWECRCERRTILPLHDLQGMSERLRGSSTDDAFVDFVCPHCGYGTRRFLRDIPDHPHTGSPIHFHPPLFHVALRCAVKGCDTHATVHTLAESGNSSAEQTKKVPRWTLEGIGCYAKHPILTPLALISSWVTNPGGED